MGTLTDLAPEQEFNPDVFVAIGGAGAAIGASPATVIESDPELGLVV